jgi:hypothetical protein
MKTLTEWADEFNRKCYDHLGMITPEDIRMCQNEALEAFKISAYSTTNVIRAERIKKAMRRHVVL